LGINQAKQDSRWIGGAVGQDGRRVQLDACSDSSLVVSDLERAPSEHRSDAAHLDRSGKKAKSQEQKHQQPEIQNGEGDKKSLSLHDLSPVHTFV
jgi:hypothetical protein